MKANCSNTLSPHQTLCFQVGCDCGHGSLQEVSRGIYHEAAEESDEYLRKAL